MYRFHKKMIAVSLALPLLLINILPVNAYSVGQNYPASNPYHADDAGVCMDEAWQQAYDRMGIRLPYIEYPHIATNGYDDYSNIGNSWCTQMAAAGYTVDSVPRENAIAIFSHHAAYVLSVDSGSSMTTWDGNWGYRGNAGAHSGIPTQIGANAPGGTLMGFLHLEIPRVVSATKFTDAHITDVYNNGASFEVTFNDDLTHPAAPSEVGCIVGSAADFVTAATPDNHPSTFVAVKNDQNLLNQLYTVGSNLENRSTYDFSMNDGSFGSMLEPNTAYYYKFYAKTNGTIIYSDVNQFRTFAGNSIKMYRLYNPNSGEHLYTSSASERDNITPLGWIYEGVGWIAPVSSNSPVYRLYNPNSGDHHYTLEKWENDWLVTLGWKAEGIGWYSDDNQAVPIYRQFNPNVTVGTHNYTREKWENDWLVTLGWKAEGIGWYGID